MISDEEAESNAGSHVNRIPGVSLDDAGFIHTAYGSYHPVTGEGLPVNAPDELMRQIPIALLRDGEDSGPAEGFDMKQWIVERFGEKPDG